MIYVIFILSIILGYFSTQKNNKLLLILNVIILSMFIGFRDITVGDDTETYYNFLEQLKSNVYSPNVEFGFLLLCKFFLVIFFNNNAMVFFAISFITNFCILVRLWTLRNKINFTLSLALFLFLFYPQTCNIIRQYIVVSILFLATILLEKRRFILYILINLLMIFIHKTALLGLIIPVVYFISNIGLRTRIKKTNWFVLGVTAFISIIAGSILFYVYLPYLINNNNSFGFMNFIKIGLFFITYSMIGKNAFYIENKQLIKFISYSYFIGICVSCLGYFNTTLTRIGLYFSIFEILYISMICRSVKLKIKCVNQLYYGLVLVLVAINIATGWSELANYSLCF